MFYQCGSYKDSKEGNLMFIIILFLIFEMPLKMPQNFLRPLKSI